MTELGKRILLVIISIPLIILVIFFLPFMHFFFFSLIVIIFSYLGTVEFLSLAIKKNRKSNWNYLFGLLGITFPILPYLKAVMAFSRNLSEAIFVLVAGIILLMELVKYERGRATNSIPRLTIGMTAIIYPGLFLSYLLKLILLPHTTGLICFFLLIVFINDTSAYVFGMLFGRNSWKPFVSSPKKSITGYISGSLTAIIAGVLFRYFFPDIIPASLPVIGILSFLLSVTANIGDLIESVLKRSAGVKDSGTLMLGRGGVLDSIDSMLLSAPLFYFFLTIIY